MGNLASIQFDKPTSRPTTVHEIFNLATEEEENALDEGIIDETKYYCSHIMQRKVGQWSKKDKTALIDSLIKGIPIGNFIVVIEEETDKNGNTRKIHYILDGIQRINALRECYNGNYNLVAGCEDIDATVEEIKEDKEFIERLNSQIETYPIYISDCSDCTQEQIRELFLRTNGGKPLNPSQKEATHLDVNLRKGINKIRKITIPVTIKHFSYDGQELKDKAEIKNVLFWDKTAISAINCNRDMDRDIIMQTLYLMTLKPGETPVSYTTQFLYSTFGKELSDMPEEQLDKLFSRLEKAIKSLGNYLPSIKIKGYTKLKKTSLPFALYSMDKINTAKGNKKAFAYALYKFCMTYKTNEDYLPYVTKGTLEEEKIKGRLDYFKDLTSKMQVTEEDTKQLEESLFVVVTEKKPKEKKEKKAKKVTPTTKNEEVEAKADKNTEEVKTNA